ncbi:alpha-L-rhamnosidase [Pseudoduganella lurida]|uniref:Alpha-L-rhamnosidase n=1 Tax=Pseudoduganella lurida TaxID=1036180 RepID=A0A562RJB2_9BURK|nr:glycosyl hydrolase family 28 protein [Pseudoduganella lurida]TWI69148.1 alpha-L-rhamnosidase [Pseudoduganella lurida]
MTSRRTFTIATLLTAVAGCAATGSAPDKARLSITEFGAVADGAQVNTAAIQAAIDRAAATGGGTVVIPTGVFVSGALFFKPGVHLHFDGGAVLQCSTDLSNFPPRRTRIEGHFEERFTPALLNADGCDGFRITGQGTVDGAGRPVWEQFWKLRNAAPNPGNFPNIGLPRARLALIENSKNVVIEGLTFKDSQFWNLHLYKCDDVVVRNSRFLVPDDVKQAPSTDGIDLDSCRNVLVEGCYFSVTDDCIAAKGSKGPRAHEDKDSPPVERIRVRNCEFRRGHGVVTLGSEATVVRDVLVENCRITGPVTVARLKLRPDTPQHYENIVFRNITLDAEGGDLIAVLPWSQYVDLKGQPPPQSVVRNVQLIGFKGRFGGFGTVKPNPGQTTISDILFRDFDVRLNKGELVTAGAANLRYDRVNVNGKAVRQ